IDNERHAETLEIPEDRLRFRPPTAKYRLGYLECQAGRIQPGLLEQPAERRQQIAIGELALVHVDARAEARLRRKAALPAQQGAAGGVEAPPGERDEESR